MSASQAAAAAADASPPPAKRQRTVWSDEKRAECVRLASFGFEVSSVALLLGMHPNTVRNILKVYDEQGRTERVRHGQGDKRALTAEQQDTLLRTAHEHGFWSLNQMASDFQRNTGRKLQKTTVSRHITADGMRRKRAREQHAKNSAETKEKRVKWLKENKAKLAVDNTVYFDETSLDSSIVPTWFWTPKGEAGQHKTAQTHASLRKLTQAHASLHELTRAFFYSCMTL